MWRPCVMVFSLVLMTTACVALSGPEEPDPGTERGPVYLLRLEGTVTSTEDGAPIEGALLKLWERDRQGGGLGQCSGCPHLGGATSNERGRYSFAYDGANCSSAVMLTVNADRHRPTESYPGRGGICDDRQPVQRLDFRLQPW